MVWNKIETASREKIDEIALRRLRDTVERVYSLNSFYKGKFDELGIKPGDIKELKDVEKLPFTRKRDLREHYPFGLFSVFR